LLGFKTSALRLEDTYLFSPQHHSVLSQGQTEIVLLISSAEELRQVFQAIYKLALRSHTPAALSFLGLGHSLLRAQISNYIANCTAPRFIASTLLYEELRKQLQTRGVCLVVNGMRERNLEVGKGMEVWERMLEWYVGVLAQQWWERFV
jgi:hypothetical protein